MNEKFYFETDIDALRDRLLHGYDDHETSMALRSEAAALISDLRTKRDSWSVDREEIAKTIWLAEFRRATGKERSITWCDVAETDRQRYLFLADAIKSLPQS